MSSTWRRALGVAARRRKKSSAASSAPAKPRKGKPPKRKRSAIWTALGIAPSRRFVRKHHVLGLGAWGAILGFIASVLLFRGVVTIGTGLFSAGVVGGSAYIRHRQRKRLMGNARPPTFAERRGAARDLRAGRPWSGPAPSPTGSGGQTWVSGHSRDGKSVGGYYQKRPGTAS